MTTETRSIKRSFMTWGTGRSYLEGEAPRGAAAVVVLEDAAHLADVVASAVVTDRSVVFVPDGGAGAADAAAGPRVLRYAGSAAEPGDELSVGDDVFVQIQDYATSEYLSLVGPTLIRMVEPDDFATFLRDADRAVHEGRFAEFAIHPAVQFADQPALGAGPGGDGPGLRLHLSASGQWSTSPAGSPLGRLGDPWPVLDAAWHRRNEASARPCSTCLGRVVPDDERIPALAARPWIGHYLDALATRRDLAARRMPEARVSGFGGRLSPALADRPTVDDGGSAPPAVLAWTDDAAFLHVPGAARTFQINRSAAAVVEALLVCGSVAAARDVAPADQLVAADEHLRARGIVVDEPVGAPR